jgi:hypothetical protein
VAETLSDEEKAALAAAKARAEQLWGNGGTAWYGNWSTGFSPNPKVHVVGIYDSDEGRDPLASGVTWEEAFEKAERRCAPGLVAELASVTAELKKREEEIAAVRRTWVEEVNLEIARTTAAERREAGLRCGLRAIHTTACAFEKGDGVGALCTVKTMAESTLASTPEPKQRLSPVSAEQARARNVDHAAEHGPTPLREIGAAEAAGERSTFVVARDPARKMVKLGGLGCLGVGEMWFADSLDHQTYAGYAEAPIEDSAGGFGTVPESWKAGPAATQESKSEAHPTEQLSVEEGGALSAAKLRAYGLYAGCGDAVRARGGGLYSVVLRGDRSGAGILLGQGKTWEEAFAAAELHCAPRLVARLEHAAAKIARLDKERDSWPSVATRAVDARDKAEATAEREIRARAAAEQTRDTVRAENAKLWSDISQLEDALHRDKTGLAAALGQIRATVNGRAWVAEGRGPYEWDDDRYKAEAGDALRTVAEIAESALRSSGDLARMAANRGPARDSEERRELAAVVDRVREAGAWLAAAGFDDSPPGCGPVHRMLARLKTALRMVSSYENEKHRSAKPPAVPSELRQLCSVPGCTSLPLPRDTLCQRCRLIEVGMELGRQTVAQEAVSEDELAALAAARLRADFAVLEESVRKAGQGLHLLSLSALDPHKNVPLNRTSAAIRDATEAGELGRAILKSHPATVQSKLATAELLAELEAASEKKP